MKTVIINYEKSQRITLVRDDGWRAVIVIGSKALRRVLGVRALDSNKVQLIQTGLEPGHIITPAWFPPEWPRQDNGGIA